MKTFVMAAAAVLISTSAFAHGSAAVVKDHHKVVIESTPYSVEVCRDVVVEKKSQGFDLGGALIGGIIGNNLPGEEGGGAAGALLGGLLGGQDTTESHTERRCSTETRHKEVEKTVYSHSTVTFRSGGMSYTLTFQK